MSTLDTAEQDRSSRTAAEWLWPLLPIGASVFCLSALFYFHVNHGAVNPTSPLQRVIAALYRTFGLAPAVMFFFMAGTWSTIWFVTGKLERPLVRIGRLLAMAVMLGVFLNLGEGGVTAAVHKGELGAWLAGALVSTIGYFPSIVMVWAITFASLLLATDFFFSDSFERMRTRPAPVETGVETDVTDHLRGLQSALHGSFDGLPAPVAVNPLVVDDAAAVDEAWPAPAEATTRDEGAAHDAVVAAAATESAGDPSADRIEPAPVDAARGDGAADLAISAALVDEREPAAEFGAAPGAEPVIAIPRPEAPRAPAAEAPSTRREDRFAESDVDDALLAEATELIRGSRRVTATFLQRRLRIGYDEAIRLLGALAARGTVELEADASQGRVVV